MTHVPRSHNYSVTRSSSPYDASRRTGYMRCGARVYSCAPLSLKRAPSPLKEQAERIQRVATPLYQTRTPSPVRSSSTGGLSASPLSQPASFMLEEDFEVVRVPPLSMEWEEEQTITAPTASSWERTKVDLPHIEEEPLPVDIRGAARFRETPTDKTFDFPEFTSVDDHAASYWGTPTPPATTIENELLALLPHPPTKQEQTLINSIAAQIKLPHPLPTSPKARRQLLKSALSAIQGEKPLFYHPPQNWNKVAQSFDHPGAKKNLLDLMTKVEGHPLSAAEKRALLTLYDPSRDVGALSDTSVEHLLVSIKVPSSGAALRLIQKILKNAHNATHFASYDLMAQLIARL